jgi:hypothetical protein
MIGSGPTETTLRASVASDTGEIDPHARTPAGVGSAVLINAVARIDTANEQRPRNPRPPS